MLKVLFLVCKVQQGCLCELQLYFPHAYTLWPVPVAFYISLVEPARGIFQIFFPSKWNLLLCVGFILCIHIIAKLLHVQ